MFTKFMTFLGLVALATSCTTTKEPQRYSGGLINYSTLQNKLTKRKIDLKIFKKNGPFAVTLKHEFNIRIKKDTVINADLYISNQDTKGPLLIFQHGNRSSKHFHATQAYRAASWGMHALVIDQPNQHQWIKNGDNLSSLIGLLHKWPEVIDSLYNPNKIILIGHSFGASAASIAAGQNPKLRGLILLDPALVSNKVKPYIEKVQSNTIILGADSKVFKSRRRETFFKLIPSSAVEISVKGATHNDAQYPNQFSFAQMIGLETAPSKDKQETFTAAIIAAAFSLGATGESGIAWKSFKKELSKGKISQIQKK